MEIRKRSKKVGGTSTERKKKPKEGMPQKKAEKAHCQGNKPRRKPFMGGK